MFTVRTEWCQLPQCSDEFTPIEGGDGRYCSTSCEEQHVREQHEVDECDGPGFCEYCDEEH